MSEIREEKSQTTRERLDDLENQLNQHDGKIKDTYNIAVLGFIVLLVTVAGVVVTVVLNYKNAADRQTESFQQLQKEEYEFLKQKIQNLENR